MRRYFVLVGLLLLTAGLALAQGEYPKVETSPAFMYIRTPISFNVPGGPSVSQSFNCAGGGGTLAYNFSSAIGIAADLGGCKYFGQTIPAPISTNVDWDWVYLFVWTAAYLPRLKPIPAIWRTQLRRNAHRCLWQIQQQ